MRGLKVLACLVIAYANVVSSYNPYAFQSRFAPVSFDYSSMGDVDWSKRSNDDPVTAESLYELKRAPYRYPKSYKFRQPYMRARPSHDTSAPYQAYSRYNTVARPQTRNKLGERQYGYASMADADWGWKKRSQWPALVDVEDTPEGDIDNLELEKKNLVSLAKSNMFPIKSDRVYGKRNDDLEEALDTDYEGFNEEKRHVGSVLRSIRSGGVASMVRNGGIRQKQA